MKKTKKKSPKKIVRLLVVLFVLLIVGLGIYYFLTSEDEENSLTILEKQWIENNKETLIDIEVPNNLGIISNNGKGVIFNLLDYLERTTSLKFNKISYDYPNYEEKNENILSIATLKNNATIKENDMLILEDSYVVIGKTSSSYNDEKFLNNTIVGVLSNDNDVVSSYFKESRVTIKTGANYDALISMLKQGSINYIIVPRYANFDSIVKTSDTYINYYLNNLSNKIVLRMGNNEKLNTIVSKLLEIWLNDRYRKDLESSLMTYYEESGNITSLEKSTLTSKVYKYGYVKDLAYNFVRNKDLYGISGEYINTLINMTNMDIEFVEYKDKQALKDAISNNKVDIAFVNFNYENDAYKKTSSPFIERFVAISKNYKNIDNKNGLINNKLYLKSDDLLYEYIKNNINASIKEIKSYTSNIDSDGIMILDENDYLYLKENELKNYKYLFSDSFDGNYHFVINNKEEVLYNLFNFILNNTDNKEYKNIGLSNVIVTTTDDSNLRGLYIIILAIILVPIIISLFSIVVLKGTRKLKITRKEEFLKYNDMLTNLKNRNYLNANIEKWDDTKVYPRTIIMIDLNNLKYVNDNYGHEEGNNLIKKAGAILINTQLEKSEIIRTDGNEFLIYLIGYSKSQISTYISKLSKEFEKLPYNFGAAIGYSMIEDEIKTIDDAINEATIEMRKDKENYK